MLYLIFSFIFIFGLLFGSLTTVLIDRWYKKKGGILLGRSECPDCRHRLSARELFPVFSYIFQGGKCRHCKKKISAFYPLTELMMGLIFVLLSMAFFFLDGRLFSFGHFILLFSGFITGVYIVYDILYMEIPDQIMIPGILLYLVLFLIIGIIGEDHITLFDRTSYLGDTSEYIFDHLLSAWILYTFFFLQILIPGAYYLIRKGRYLDSLGLMSGYVLFPLLLIIPRWLEHKIWKKESMPEEDIPTWVGGGDLRVALFIGLSLGTLHGFAALGFAYIIGSIVSILFLFWERQKLGKRGMSKIAFGPFLGIGWLLAVLFHEQIIIFFTSSIVY